MAMSGRGWLGLGAAFLSIAGAGCATEEWTHTLLAKREVEVDQRFVKVEDDVREHEERIDRIEVQVSQLDTRLTETRDLVRASLPQTPSVAMRPPFPERRPGRSTADRLRSVRSLVGIVSVPFGFDRADLDATAEAALGAILKELRDNPGMTIDLEGTTDSTGRRDYNIRLSQRRVETVIRWLVARGVERARIVGSAGRGPLADDSVTEAGKRRVMVKLMAPGE
jgi:outer membrane protein OmpA-like peptidoglycan-associated protein